jgi:hypothetical protein
MTRTVDNLVQWLRTTIEEGRIQFKGDDAPWVEGTLEDLEDQSPERLMETLDETRQMHHRAWLADQSPADAWGASYHYPMARRVILVAAVRHTSVVFIGAEGTGKAALAAAAAAMGVPASTLDLPCDPLRAGNGLATWYAPHWPMLRRHEMFCETWSPPLRMLQQPIPNDYESHRQTIELAREHVCRFNHVGWDSLDDSSTSLMKQAVDRMRLSLKRQIQTISMAGSIASLDRSDQIIISHLAEAIQYTIGRIEEMVVDASTSS